MENEAFKLLNDYMEAWNRRDLAALEETFHFPHYRFARNRMLVLEKPGLQEARLVWGFVGPDWGHSEWVHMRIVHASGDKIHVDTKFARFRTDGSLIGAYESLYILTHENGRWGIRMRSSFT